MNSTWGARVWTWYRAKGKPCLGLFLTKDAIIIAQVKRNVFYTVSYFIQARIEGIIQGWYLFECKHERTSFRLVGALKFLAVPFNGHLATLVVGILSSTPCYHYLLRIQAWPDAVYCKAENLLARIIIVIIMFFLFGLTADADNMKGKGIRTSKVLFALKPSRGIIWRIPADYFKSFTLLLSTRLLESTLHSILFCLNSSWLEAFGRQCYWFVRSDTREISRGIFPTPLEKFVILKLKQSNQSIGLKFWFLEERLEIK